MTLPFSSTFAIGFRCIFDIHFHRTLSIVFHRTVAVLLRGFLIPNLHVQENGPYPSVIAAALTLSTPRKTMHFNSRNCTHFRVNAHDRVLTQMR